MLIRYCNALALIGIFLILLLAFTFQLALHEMPCPLCFLQRLGFLGAGFGFLMNLRFGMRPSHYAIVLISALFSGLIGLKQVLLHIVPGTGAYGSAFLGFHLYTWSFIGAMVIILGTAALLAIDRQYTFNHVHKPTSRWTHVGFVFLLLLIFANILSALLLCGFSFCSAHPLYYHWHF